MKRIVLSLFLSLCLFVATSCHIYKLGKLKGPAEVLEKYSDNSYRVTAGFIKKWIQSCTVRTGDDGECEDKAMSMTIAELADGTWLVKAEMIEGK